jgi:uncharacterized protein DUF1059
VSPDFVPVRRTPSMYCVAECPECGREFRRATKPGVLAVVNEHLTSVHGEETCDCIRVGHA